MELKNKRHEAFCQEYLKDLNATAAYRRVYGEKENPKTAEVNGARLLGNASVRQRIDTLVEARSQRVQVTADDILRSILDIRERCLEATPAKDKQGNELGHYLFDAKNALKANELLGRHISLFNDKLNVKTEITSIEQLVRKAKEQENE